MTTNRNTLTDPAAIAARDERCWNLRQAGYRWVDVAHIVGLKSEL